MSTRQQRRFGSLKKRTPFVAKPVTIVAIPESVLNLWPLYEYLLWPLYSLPFKTFTTTVLPRYFRRSVVPGLGARTQKSDRLLAMP